jgi:hypothetical protein
VTDGTDGTGADGPHPDPEVEQICAAIRAGDAAQVIVATRGVPAARRRAVHSALVARWQQFRDAGIHVTETDAPDIPNAYRLATAGVAPTPADVVRDVVSIPVYPKGAAARFDPRDWATVVEGRGSAWLARCAASLLAGGGGRNAGERWRVVHTLVLRGLIEAPRHPHYAHLLLYAYPWATLPELIAADPTIAPLARDLLRTPDVGLMLGRRWGTPPPLSPGWTRPPQPDPGTSVYADDNWRGLLDAWGAFDPSRRPTVIDDCLRALSGSLPERDAPGFVAILDRLAITVDEAAIRQARYLPLLLSAASSAVVMAHWQVRRLMDAGRLGADLLLDVTTDALLRPEKGKVREHLKLLTDAVEAGVLDPEACAWAVAGALDGNRHDVTVAMGRLLARCARGLDDDARQALAEAARTAVPAPWPELLKALGPLATVAGAPAGEGGDPGAPSPRPSPGGPPAPIDLPAPGRLEPVEDVDELTQLVSAVLEDPSSPIDVERALDGMARLGRPGPSVANALMSRAWALVGGRMAYNEGLSYAVRAWLGKFLPPVVSTIMQAGQVGERKDAPEGAHVEEFTYPSPSWPVPAAGAATPAVRVWRWHLEEPTWIPRYLLYRRLVELGQARLRDVSPGPLAMPTDVSGTISGDALLARLDRYRQVGTSPFVHDVGTALMRVDPAERELVLSAVTSEYLADRLRLLTTAPAFRRGVTPVGRLGLFAGLGLPGIAFWEVTDPADGAPDDPVRAWLDTRSLSMHWHDHRDVSHPTTRGSIANLAMVVLTLPHHPDLAATHLQPEIMAWLDEPDADLSGLLTALGSARSRLGGPALAALAWAAAYKNAMTRASAAEAIATTARHGLLDGRELGVELLGILGPEAGPFPHDGWGKPLRPKLTRVIGTLADASRVHDQAGFAVLGALTGLLPVAATLNGGVSIVELAAQLAERYRVPVDLPDSLAALAAGRSSSRTAQEARRLAAAGR